MPLKEKSTHIAEVIAASITHFEAETISEHRPNFGSFIKAQSLEKNLDIYAIVFNIVTNSPDNIHKPMALGLSRAELQVEQPHIFSLLKTHIHAQIIGYRQEQTEIFHSYLPPTPPEVHDFIYPCSTSEIISLCQDFEFLRLLTSVKTPPPDELISAAIRQAGQAQESNNVHQFHLEAGRAICQLYRGDSERMLSILKKIRPA
jgi:hypothetical protein